jgi:hypothetical protein
MTSRTWSNSSDGLHPSAPADPSTAGVLISRDAVTIGAGAVWCQFGVINDEGSTIASDAGLTAIVDCCLKVGQARYVGRMRRLASRPTASTSVRAGPQ